MAPWIKKGAFYTNFRHISSVSIPAAAILPVLMVSMLIIAGCMAPADSPPVTTPATIQTSSATVIEVTTPPVPAITTTSPLPAAGITPNATFPQGATLETGAKKQAYPYAIRTRSQSLYLTTYDGVADYLQKKYPDRPTDFYNPSTLEPYYRQYVGDPVQEKYLADFVRNIHDRSELPEERVRIAVSLIQHIPYAPTTRTLYPYEVLHYDMGKCEDKSILMAYVLSQMGYGTSLFLYYPEHHMALGLRCPKQYSYNGSGYCFVETTAPSIMTYSNGTYEDVGKLVSTPEIIKISDGDSFDQISEEYTDARSFDTVINSASWDGSVMTLDAINYNQLGYLRQKYGLWDIDIRQL
jgi:hypothetical protein